MEMMEISGSTIAKIGCQLWMGSALAVMACGKASQPANSQSSVEGKSGPIPTKDKISKQGGDRIQTPSPSILRERAKAMFGKLPEVAKSNKHPSNEAMIELGRMLYYDTRLSKNHDISCNSCHLLDKYGVDGEKTSPGHRGQRGERNSPTVYNAAFHISQFWDGRAADVEEQAKGPILNPVEMAMLSEKAVEDVLRSIPDYVTRFAKAFPGNEPLTYKNMADAIAAFERKLVTPSSFDSFLAGNNEALSSDAQAGLHLFMTVGCTTCHSGSLLGGAMYQKLGVTKPYTTEDVGRFGVTKNEADKHVFKVPSLRNVAKTGPYLHDGSVVELEKVVAIMAEYQTAAGALSGTKTKAIVAFLNSLTGELPKDYIKKPELPVSGPKTPKPDPS